MWSGSIGRIRSGDVEIDPVLAAGKADGRRGMTLVMRPGPEIQRRVGMSLDELRALEPDQYYYHAAELHVTFLAMFTATENSAPLLARSADYAAAISASAERLRPFPLEFTGLTASPGAIVAQGFCDADALNEARDDLRQELHNRGLGEGLDGRYRLETAHMTLVRFRAPLRDPGLFANALEKLRAVKFGAFAVDALELNENDWYMSRGQTQCVRRYALVAR
jgi:2'-5' RNA ligase